MMLAVSLSEAKKHLRVEIDDDDALIVSYIQAYTEVAEHLMLRPIFGDDGVATNTEDVPCAIKQWILLHVGLLYENRASGTTSEVKPLPNIDVLLTPYKKWN